MQYQAWAEEEFGQADLGDKRRTKRLVVMAGRYAEKPAGKLTEVYEWSAERQAAYKFLEAPHVCAEEMERARGRACAQRASHYPLVLVPVDQTSFHLSDEKDAKTFGSIGKRSSGAQGVHAMTGLVLDEEGVPLGVLYQSAWERSNEPGPPTRTNPMDQRSDKRPLEERESYAWIEVLGCCERQLRTCATNTRAWYQADQGADYWKLFDWAHEHGVLLTVRISHERAIVNRGHDNHLRPWITTQPVSYKFSIKLPARYDRAARDAHLSVRFGTTTVLYKPKHWTRLPLVLSVVAITEPRPPSGAEPIHWLLATTYPVRTEEDAVRVIRNYTFRWRTEDFHRTLKSGACNLETSALQSFETFSKLLIIASSVATRIERIKLLSRTQPDEPATVAYSRDEIDVMQRLRLQHMPNSKYNGQPGEIPSLHLMTRWVAEFGGYQLSPTRGPPGTIVLNRGLLALEAAVLGARAVRRRTRDPTNG